MAFAEPAGTTIWVSVVGAAAIASAMTIAFWLDYWGELYTLYSLAVAVLLNPLVFAAGSGVAYWRAGGLRGASIVFGVFLLTFAVAWQIESNWVGFSWGRVGSGLVETGLAAALYLVVSGGVVAVLVLIRRVKRPVP